MLIARSRSVAAASSRWYSYIIRCLTYDAHHHADKPRVRLLGQLPIRQSTSVRRQRHLPLQTGSQNITKIIYRKISTCFTNKNAFLHFIFPTFTPTNATVCAISIKSSNMHTFTLFVQYQIILILPKRWTQEHLQYTYYLTS